MESSRVGEGREHRKAKEKKTQQISEEAHKCEEDEVGGHKRKEYKEDRRRERERAAYIPHRYDSV
jgi:hypothetical protein